MGLETIAIAALALSAAGTGAAVIQQQVASHKTKSTLADQRTVTAANLESTKKANAEAAAKAEEESAAIAAKETQDIAAAESARAAGVAATKRTTAAREEALQTTGRPSTFATGNAFGLRTAAPVKKKKLGQ